MGARVQLLRAGANVQAVGAEGSTALHEAIARGNHREALLLLSAGANPFCENNGGALRERSKSLFRYYDCSPNNKLPFGRLLLLRWRCCCCSVRATLF